MDILERRNKLFVSYSLIRKYGISKRTIWKWDRFRIETIKEGNDIYIALDSIPAPTLSKLPTELEFKAMLKAEVLDELTENLYLQLKNAMSGHSEYREYYRVNYDLNKDEVQKASLMRAVWGMVLDLYSRKRHGGKVANGYLSAMLKAYSKIYPMGVKGGLSCVQDMSRKIKTAEQRGVDAIIIDKRGKTNHNKHTQKYKEQHFYILHSLISSPKAYKAPAIHKKMMIACTDLGMETPSLSWVKLQKSNIVNQVAINKSRFGALPSNKLNPFAGIKNALHACDQFQVDGWDLPFYYLGENSKGEKRLRKLTLIAVKDNYSRKIVGYSIAQSENRLSLLEAFENTVNNCGGLPFELVTDNHAYNETKEVNDFVAQSERFGMTYTITSNPQQKSIIERGFGVIGEAYCKEHYGYIGQGVKTRDKDGRSSQEYIDKCLKANKILQHDEIVAIGVYVVQEFNKTILKQFGKSPDQLFTESKKPNLFPVDECEKLKLFTRSTEYKISRGQINIQIAGVKYEYALNAEMFHLYNNKTVTVRYQDLNRIYLFDKKTDEPIGSVGQKEKAFGALANQTQVDIDILNRHKGKMEGIKAKARKDNEDLARKAEEMSPGIIELMNRLTTPKDVIKMAEEDEFFRQAVEERGVRINHVISVKKESEIELPAFKTPEKTKRERSPFAPKNHKISIINFDDEE